MKSKTRSPPPKKCYKLLRSLTYINLVLCTLFCCLFLKCVIRCFAFYFVAEIIRLRRDSWEEGEVHETFTCYGFER